MREQIIMINPRENKIQGHTVGEWTSNQLVESAVVPNWGHSFQFVFFFLSRENSIKDLKKTKKLLET